jgi:polysaccharide biosynthesis/export protein
MPKSVTATPMLAFLVCCLCLAACSSPPAYFSKNGPGTTTGNLAPSLTPITPELVTAQQAMRQRQGAQDISGLAARITPYVIGAGDVLSIVVWGHPELAAAVLSTQTPLINPAEQAAAAAVAAQGFVVSDAGIIQFPFAGTLQVGGLTEVQARDLLSKRIAHVINAPNVTLRVQSFRSRRIYMDGEVKAPGLLAINDIPMTLVEALNRAGGALPTADQSHIAIMREGKRYLINLPGLIQQGVDPAAIVLRHGDVVRVFSSDESKVFVTGEVITPRSLTMHNGRLTLNEAIGEAGGINPVTGDARQIYVVRRADGLSQVFHLDAQDPGALAIAENFELTPRDLVYIAPTGLSNWHRTLSMLIPGALTSAISVGKQ